VTPRRPSGARLALPAALLGCLLEGCGAGAPSAPSPTARPTVTARTSSKPTAAPTPACSNLQVLAGWGATRVAAQLVVVPADETDVGVVADSVLEGAGGVILFGSQAPTDLGQQLRTLEQEAVGWPAPLVMTDEEGGGVQRMANLVGSLPWPATMAATMTPAAVQQAVQQVDEQMAADGVTMDLAPVLDLASGPGPDSLHTDGPRSFGLSASTATTYGLAFVRGLEAGGVIPVVKHFPGEGQATANTDDGPASTPPYSELEQADLLPFKAAISAGIPAVMVGNATVPGLSSVPSSLSSAVIQGLLRQQYGFQGLVITDSLSAGAISDIGISVPQAAVEAVEAGADLVLYTSDDPTATFDQVVDALVAAVAQGQLSSASLDAAAEHVLAVKGVNLCAGRDG